MWSPSYYRRLERRKAAAAEATAGSSSEKESQEKCDNVPAEEVGSESEGSSGEAATVSCPEKTNSAMNWIYGVNEVQKGKHSEWSISNLEAIIIDTVASIESVDSSSDYGRYIKCKHCKSSMIEDNFALHRCYNRDQGFQDDVITRVEPGVAEVRSILCL